MLPLARSASALGAPLVPSARLPRPRPRCSSPPPPPPAGRRRHSDLALAMEPEASDGGGLGGPGTPPCCGSDLDITILLDGHNAQCPTILLTTPLAKRPDPQWKIDGPPEFGDFERCWRSIMAFPADAGGHYSTGDWSVSFVKVDISGLDPLMGLNDLRCRFFEDQGHDFPQRPQQRRCVAQLLHLLGEAAGEGRQNGSVKPFEYMRGKFAELRGKSLDWYDSQADHASVSVEHGHSRWKEVGGPQGHRGHMHALISYLELVSRRPSSRSLRTCPLSTTCSIQASPTK